MRHICLVCLLGLSLTPVAWADAPPKVVAVRPKETVTTHSCGPSVLSIDGNSIWVNRQGVGTLTVVFEAGFGSDSTAWTSIEPKIRAAGVQTFLYDRAGMRNSTIDTTIPYSIDNDVHILRSALIACGITGPIVMVGHSYGGAISLVAATQDANIKGLVLVDALIPNVWPGNEALKIQALLRADYDQTRKEDPRLAPVVIGFGEALPKIYDRINTVWVSDTLPVIDIVAQKGQDTPELAQKWNKAHFDFTASKPHRQSVLAAGSSHKVVRDRPDVVIDAVLTMIKKVR